MKTLFTPKIKTVHNFTQKFSAEEIEDEPMIYNGDLSYSYDNGGPITRLVLDKIIEIKPRELTLSGLHPLIDTKVVMVNKGQYPCLGGWHCDDIPRVDNDHQPDLTKVNEDIRHWLVFFSDVGNLTGTEFIINPMEVEIDTDNVWGSLDKTLESKDLKTRRCQDGELIEFNQLAIHRGTPANSFGWRFFFRLTMSKRQPTNKIRKQVQIYSR